MGCLLHTEYPDQHTDVTDEDDNDRGDEEESKLVHVDLKWQVQGVMFRRARTLAVVVFDHHKPEKSKLMLAGSQINIRQNSSLQNGIVRYSVVVDYKTVNYKNGI